MRDLLVKVKLSANRTLNVNLRKELTIDISNLTGELLSQVGRYAWWAVAEELSYKKVMLNESLIDEVKQELLEESGIINLGDRRLKKAVSGYVRASNQHDFLLLVKEAFEHRRDTLIILMNSQSHESVLHHYNSIISNYLMALGA